MNIEQQSAYTSFEALNTDQEDTKVDSDAKPVAAIEPNTMRAIVFNKFGPIKDVVQEKSLPIPTVKKPDDVLVKVLYAAMNPVDYKVIKGAMGALSPRKPGHVTGCDFCGKVMAKGNGDRVRFLEVGTLVFGQKFDGDGTFAEYTVVPVSNVAKVPDNMSPMEAAAMPLVCQTSYQAMEKMKINESSKLLILGGSSACGVVAIQMAKNHFGCSEVAVTSSREKLCMELGADSVVNYKEQKWEEIYKDHGFDAVYDCVGGVESWDLCRSERVLKDNGHFVTVVGDVSDEKGQWAFDAAAVLSMVGSAINRKFWSALGEQNWDMLLEDASKNMDDIAQLMRDGKVKPVLDDESPFEFKDWAKMFEKQMALKARGKLVIKIADDGADGTAANGNQEEETKNEEPLAPASVPQDEVVVEEDTKEEVDPVAADEVKVNEEPAAVDPEPVDDAADKEAEDAKVDPEPEPEPEPQPESEPAADPQPESEPVPESDAPDEAKPEEPEQPEVVAADDQKEDKADVATEDQAVDDGATKEDGAEAAKSD